MAGGSSTSHASATPRRGDHRQTLDGSADRGAVAGEPGLHGRSLRGDPPRSPGGVSRGCGQALRAGLLLLPAPPPQGVAAPPPQGGRASRSRARAGRAGLPHLPRWRTPPTRSRISGHASWFARWSGGGRPCPDTTGNTYAPSSLPSTNADGSVAGWSRRSTARCRLDAGLRRGRLDLLRPVFRWLTPGRPRLRATRTVGGGDARRPQWSCTVPASQCCRVWP